MPLLANINVGSNPNDGTGSSLRDSFIIINENFQFIESFFPNTSNIALVANVTSTGVSTFNTLTANSITGPVTGNVTGNVSGTLLGNVIGSTVSAATIGNTGASIVGTLSTAAQTNITSVGTLTGLTLSGNLNGTSINASTVGNLGTNLVGATVSAASVGNTGTILTGTIGSASESQPNITQVGTLSNLTISGNLNMGFQQTIAGNRLNIHSLTHITRTSLTGFGTNVTAIPINFASNISQYAAVQANANVTVTYSNIADGYDVYLGVKNTSGGTIYASLPSDTNNKGSNLIPIGTGVTASFTFHTFDATTANVIVSIVNN